jgi:hypothetical protein
MYLIMIHQYIMYVTFPLFRDDSGGPAWKRKSLAASEARSEGTVPSSSDSCASSMPPRSTMYCVTFRWPSSAAAQGG